jgi:zinc transport system substrate-binding protein
MAPPQLLIMADNIAEALQAVDGKHAAEYERNLNALKSDLADLHEKLDEMLQPYKGRTFYIYHPALGYFAEAYGLHQESVEVGGKKPTPRQLQELIEQAQKDNVAVIFVQPQFDQRSAATVAEAIGGSVVPLDPLRKDAFANLRDIGAKLAAAFGAENAP